MHRVVTGLAAAILVGLCMGQGCVPASGTDGSNSDSGTSGQSGSTQPSGGQQQAQGQQPLTSRILPGTYHPSGTATEKMYVNSTLYETTNQNLDSTPQYFGPHGLPLTNTDADIYTGYIQTVSFAGSTGQFKVTGINATSDTLTISYDVALGCSVNSASYELSGPVTDVYQIKSGETLEETMSGQIALTTGELTLSGDLLLKATLSTTLPVVPPASQGGTLPVVLPAPSSFFVTPTCGGQFRDATTRFSLDLPDNSVGPAFPVVAGSVVAFEWTSLDGTPARLDVAVFLSPTPNVATRIPDLLQAEIAQGDIEFDSLFYTMSSGVNAWYHRYYSTTSGYFGAEVIAVARGRWFTITVAYPDIISDQQTLSILNSLNSFCVEP